MTNSKSTEADRRSFERHSIWVVRAGHRKGTWIAVYEQLGSMLNVRALDSTDRKDSFWLSAHKLEDPFRWATAHPHKLLPLED